MTSRAESREEAIFLGPEDLLNRLQTPAFVIGGIALALSLIGAVLTPTQFFRSYLVSYIFWSGIALGCLAILMLQHITGGTWGAVIRRVLESGSATLPVLALLFIPVIVGLTHLYAWARPMEMAHHPLSGFKGIYLSAPFFVGRAVIYFAIWVLVSRLLMRWSAQQDESADPRLGRKLQLLSRGGILLYALTVTLASIDWGMSLDPHWFSTIYGIMFIGGQGVSAFAFVISIMALLARRGRMAEAVSYKQFHDLGNLLLAFVMLWAYFAFSQFLLIWSGNLAEEIPWYVNRKAGGWGGIAIFLILFHFCVPFVLLLMRDVKQRANSLLVVAMALVFVHFIDVYWVIAPSFPHTGGPFHWLDLAVAIGLGGIWVGTYIWQLKSRPLLPLNDPSLSS